MNTYPRIAVCPLTGIKRVVNTLAEENEFVFGPALWILRWFLKPRDGDND